MVSLIVNRTDQMCPQYSGAFVVSFTGSDPGPADDKALRQSIAAGQGCRYGGACGRDQFSLYGRKMHRKAVGSADIRNCRDRDGKNAVLTADRPTAFAQEGYHCGLYIQVIQADRHGYDIHNRIHCSDLMEMNLGDGKAMCFCLRLRYDFKYPQGSFLCPGCKACCFYDLLYLLQAAVHMRVRMMIMGVLMPFLIMRV